MRVCLLYTSGDGKPLLHTKRILGKELFIFVGQSYQIQSIFDSMIVWYAPQSSKDTQVLCAGQIWIKTGGLNQAADTGQQFLFIPLQGFSPDSVSYTHLDVYKRQTDTPLFE